MPKLPLALCFSLVVALAPGAAWAADANGNARAGQSDKRAAADAKARISLKDATAIVRGAYGGRVLSAAEAQRRDAQGAVVHGYRLRVDVEGTVKTVFVDVRGRIHDS